jgi:serralysin
MPAAPTDLETYFLELVNATRIAAGTSPLTFDDELMIAADDHNAWMDATDTLSHTGVNGSSIEDRISAAGYDATFTGENIWNEWGTDETGATAGATPYFVEKSRDWFVNSPPHYQTLVNPGFENIGISFMAGNYQGYPAAFATIKFGTPTAEEAAENNTPAPGDDTPVPGDTAGDDTPPTPTTEEDSGGFFIA